MSFAEVEESRERNMALVYDEHDSRVNCPECDDCDCYDEDDFKHPSYHERYADIADQDKAA
jgi:hypothetical protein